MRLVFESGRPMRRGRFATRSTLRAICPLATNSSGTALTMWSLTPSYAAIARSASSGVSRNASPITARLASAARRAGGRRGSRRYVCRG